MEGAARFCALEFMAGAVESCGWKMFRRDDAMKIARHFQRAMLIFGALFAAQAARARPPQAAATTAPTAAKSSTTIKVDVSQTWTDTKLDLRTGEELQITAAGTATYPAAKSAGKSAGKSFGPDGLARNFADLLHQYAVPDAGHGALIGRVGNTDGAQPFEVGASKKFTAVVPGRLYLGINESMRDASTAQGTFDVTIDVLAAGDSSAAAAFLPAESPIPGVNASLLDKIPRRVTDPQGNPGDMVNILLIGTQDEVLQTFKAAGWVQVDRTVQDTILAGLENTLEKKDYLTMPMSTLFLFKRPQDYGMAHAEPVRVVMSRNHLRVWKSPYSVNGTPVWCVAATHDVGFERDQRNNGLTHKIDPAIDGEREYVNDTLSATGMVAAREHLAPSAPLTDAKTATGGGFHSDGRVLVLQLKRTAASSK